MVEFKRDDNSIICILSGVLDGTEHIDTSYTNLCDQKIQILGKDIKS